MEFLIIGLLVEPNLFNYQTLLGKQRKATSINACYAMTPLPTLVDFVNAKAVSGIQGMLCHLNIKKYLQNISVAKGSNSWCILMLKCHHQSYIKCTEY